MRQIFYLYFIYDHSIMTIVKTIAIGQFKAKCLGILEQVRSKKEGIIVTKRGIPVAQVLPLIREQKSVREELLGTILFEKDIISPLEEPWEAEL